MDENIKKLLDSELEADNLLGWELVEAKKVPFKDVMDYVENSKVATMWEKRYRWDGSKFVRNKTYTGGTTTYPGNYILTTDFTGQICPGTTYTSRYFKYNSLYEIQKEKDLDKSRTI